jgi:hypothetical protein
MEEEFQDIVDSDGTFDADVSISGTGKNVPFPPVFGCRWEKYFLSG